MKRNSRHSADSREKPVGERLYRCGAEPVSELWTEMKVSLTGAAVIGKRLGQKVWAAQSAEASFRI